MIYSIRGEAIKPNEVADINISYSGDVPFIVLEGGDKLLICTEPSSYIGRVPLYKDVIAAEEIEQFIYDIRAAKAIEVGNN